MENHHFQWVHPLFLWPFSIAMSNYRRVDPNRRVSFTILSRRFDGREDLRSFPIPASSLATLCSTNLRWHMERFGSSSFCDCWWWDMIVNGDESWYLMVIHHGKCFMLMMGHSVKKRALNGDSCLLTLSIKTCKQQLFLVWLHMISLWQSNIAMKHINTSTINEAFWMW